ncbi:glycosyltransferase family protein [Marininema halotolerans]|uniref:Streptomycin biosynthesis protein StrF domain-containing protein n=1 Tax=Marininema halotolerans TaxID=1155944 RepID=A0A1I6RPM9_9BACL|nr:glycosyltransferase family protein [Marininema halotolerans]SFS66635.1 hypothetical protein SAMN05444972_105267 [Marininema halotolerans]
MNPYKVCFIWCVNDEDWFRESERYVDALTVPEGYRIEKQWIKGAKGLASGYNQGMMKSDAKYKVYLHQDVLIIHRNFLVDMVSLFQKNQEVGMLGMVGVTRLPCNGIWWEGERPVGKVYDSHTGRMELLSFGGDTEVHTKVEAVDGLLMATQYDRPWREDLFSGWHFYDLSQGKEFIRAGYEVMVPYQQKPWCIHDCGVVNVQNGFEEARQQFVNTYLDKGYE